jgi:pimeloyl-ACP methyl ester carboxylesterase
MRLVKRLQWGLGLLVIFAVIAGFGFWMRPVGFLMEWMYIRLSLSGVESHAVTVAGHRIHYDAEGPAAGPVVVLVHGLGGRAEDWRKLAPFLAKAGFRVYMPDLPGYGRSAKPSEFSYSIPDEAGAVVGFLDVMGLKQVDLGGWSMGGWIAQRVAAEHPERVRRLLLFDSAGLYEKPAWNTGLFMPVSAADIEELDALLMPHPPHVPAFVARDVLRHSRQNGWVIKRALETMLSGQDATDTLLPRLKMPVLLIWGAEDRITPLSQGEKMHRLVPQSDLVVIPGCGHLAPVQCAPAMAPKVLAFVQR